MPESITLSHDDLMRMRTAYAENEIRAVELLQKEQEQIASHSEVVKMYEYSKAKACGMKEAIDLLLYKIDGKFPD